MTVRAEFTAALGAFSLDVAFEAGDRAVAVVGPNGAGKTTLLLALAGLIPIQRGSLVIDGTVVDDVASGMHVPAQRRPVGVVFQDHRLFAHLSALENVAFGLRARGVSRRTARDVAHQWLTRVGLDGDSAQRQPHELSGGQAQRVALARALATEPKLLLLDEPLAAVDVSARPELQALIRHELARSSGSRIVVTHDPIEAAALADDLIVMEDGRVTQHGQLADIVARPRSPWVATMLGLNLLAGTASGPTVALASGQQLVTSESTTGAVFAAFRPNAVVLHRSRPEGSARNVWHATVTEMYPAGATTRVRFDGPVPMVAEVTTAATSELALRPGEPVWVSLKATEIDVYPA